MKSFSSTATLFLLLPTDTTSVGTSHQYLPTIRIQRSNLVKIEKLLLLLEAMYDYNKTQVSLYDPAKLAIESILCPEEDLTLNCGYNFKKTVSFDDIMHFIDEEKMVTYVDFDCYITFYSESPTIFRQIARERNQISRSCENLSAVPASINIAVLLMSSIPVISLWTLTIYRTWVQQLLCHSTALMVETICPISLLYQQFTNLAQTHSRCFLPYERWTVRRRDCASVSHSFEEFTYQEGEWTRQLLLLKSWVISGNPEKWMDFHCLWRTVIVFKCSYLFQLSDFFCLPVQYLLFSLKTHLFCSLSLMTLSEK